MKQLGPIGDRVALIVIAVVSSFICLGLVFLIDRTDKSTVFVFLIFGIIIWLLFKNRSLKKQLERERRERRNTEK